MSLGVPLTWETKEQAGAIALPEGTGTASLRPAGSLLSLLQFSEGKRGSERDQCVQAGDTRPLLCSTSPCD